MITTERIHDRDGFRALREDWNELLRHSEVDCLFLTWDWLFTWWEHLAEDRRLHIVTVRRDGRLIALAPLTLRPPRLRRLLPFHALEFLGSGQVGSDYLNLILRRGCEEEGLRYLTAALGEDGLVLQLSQVDRSSEQMVDMALQLRHLGWRPARRTVDFCPYIDLGGMDFETYVSNLGSSHRSNFRRRLKKLDKQFKVSFAAVSREGELGDALETLFRLHLSRWNQRGGSDALHTGALQNFHREFTRIALRKDWLRLFLLHLNGRPAAALYCFRYGQKFYLYQAGFDTGLSKFSVGLCAVGMSIERAIGEGCAEYDFLRGNESYKYLWANGERELVRLDLFPPYLRGLLVKQTMEAREEAKRLRWFWSSPKLGQ